MGVEPTTFSLQSCCSPVELQPHIGISGRTRTCSVRFRRPLRYPVALRRYDGVRPGFRTLRKLILSQLCLPVASAGHFGACEEIRTPNICVLSAAPLPIGLRKHLMVLHERFELSPLQGLNLMPLPFGLLEHIGIPERPLTSSVTVLNRKRVPFLHGDVLVTHRGVEPRFSG